MNLKNSITLIGFLGADAELTELPSGKKLARLRVATNESYKNKDNEWVTSTEWHNCVVWGGLAEAVAKQGKKGTEMVLRGKMSYRDYEDREGVKRRAAEVVVSEFTLVGRRKKEPTEA